MSSELLEIQRRMLAAMTDKDLIEDMLGLVSAYSGVGTAQLVSVNHKANIMESYFHGVDPVFREKEAEYWSINPRFAVIPQMREDRAIRDHDFISPEEMKRCTAYQELLQPAGVGNFAGLMLRYGEANAVGIALAHASDPINDEQARRLEEVGAVIKPVLEVASQFGLVQADAALSAFSPRGAAAIVRRDGVVLRMNEAFDALLREGVINLDQNRVLVMQSTKANAALSAALTAPVLTSGTRFVVRGSDPQKPLICSLYPLPVQDLMLRYGDVVVLTLEGPLNRMKLDVSIVADIYGLTGAESAVADLLFQGLDLKAIAKTRGTSVNTVRSMIKALLAKTETHRQAELVAILAAFARRAEPE